MNTEPLCLEHGGRSLKSECKQCAREANQRYYQKHRDEILERKRRYKRENREKIAEYNRRYYQENREKFVRRERNVSPESRAKHAEYNRRYRQENGERLNAQAIERRSMLNRVAQHSANNNGKRWTREEIAEMQRLREQGLSRFEIAVELGRTLNAIDARIDRENGKG